jgi:hypothetical protein
MVTLLLLIVDFKGKHNWCIAKRKLAAYPTTHHYYCQVAAWIDKQVMLAWVDKVLTPYVEIAPKDIIPLLILDSYQYHMGTTASNVKGCLAAGEYIEAWCHLKGWYHTVEDQVPKPCPETLAKQTDKRIQLYTSAPPLGWAMQLNVDPSNVPDAAPTDSELRVIVGQIYNDRAASATGMKAEHLKEWFVDMRCEEAEGGVEGIRDRWQSFLALLQAVWECRSIPTQMTWMIIVLLPKGGEAIIAVLAC